MSDEDCSSDMKELNYEILGWALKALSEKCFEAARQQKEGESVTACGMDSSRDDEPDDDIRTSQEGDPAERSYAQKSYQGRRT